MDDAYRTILSWLQAQKAQVKTSRPPAYVEASHGRALQPMGWRKDAKKTITFELTPAGTDVHLRVRMIPPMLNAGDVQMRTEEARANWNELLADLWMRFGETGALADAIRRPPGDWGASLRQGKNTMVVGGILFVVGVLIFAAFLAFSPGFVVAPTGLMVAGVLAIVYGAMTVWSASRRLAAQRGLPPS